VFGILELQLEKLNSVMGITPCVFHVNMYFWEFLKVFIRKNY